MSAQIIRLAFERRLKTWGDSQTPVIPIAWENSKFVPPDGRYVQANLLPAPTESGTLDKAHRGYSGIFQVTLVLKIDTGTSLASTLSASLDAAFSYLMTESGLLIWLTRPMSPGPSIQEGDRYRVPVSAEYRADVM